MKDHQKPIIGITIGDVNGVGPEIILKCFSDSRMFDICTPVLYGDYKLLVEQSKALHLGEVPLNKIGSLKNLKSKKLNVLDIPSELESCQFGNSDPKAGAHAFDVLVHVTKDVMEGSLEAIVTAPLNKENVAVGKPGFSGHTGFLAESDDSEALMILTAREMRIAMITGHVALNRISDSITDESIQQKTIAFNNALMEDFGIQKPKIALLGLNPHAGENGLLGEEEQKVIIPAIKQLNSKNILAFGPYPSDGFFGSGEYLKFDGIMAMYHDQALIPFKTLFFDEGVNYTAGLSFVRTSPDHGTAYGLAGKRSASEVSFRESVYAACDIVARRKSEPAKES